MRKEVWYRRDLTHTIAAVCGTAADYGGFTPETAAVVGRICQALGLAVALPEPTQATIITVIQPPALPEPRAGGALVVVNAD